MWWRCWETGDLDGRQEVNGEEEEEAFRDAIRLCCGRKEVERSVSRRLATRRMRGCRRGEGKSTSTGLNPPQEAAEAALRRRIISLAVPLLGHLTHK